jgi:hypothetical protein
MKPLKSPITDVVQPRTIDLNDGGRLVLSEKEKQSHIQLFDPAGQLTLSVVMTPEGPVLKLGGAGLKLDVEGELSFAADRVKIEGREGVEISSGGDVHTKAVGRSYQDARSHEIVSDLGDIRLKANDDVRMNGERVMVNCEIKHGTR